ncbi:hypothetical protein [Helicobacter cappadocius]|uniref:Secreted protein n=1 Tax=Helicobacter cappadocius TaxID=3063998 RepID=A0AA90PTG3_9HELI|nr:MULTISPECIES: hypothetical protein [unclassified Helicobacter]MDO7253336.1 hypothetical protein [Helicobacter sp. faydin-H75]MDP2539234.1 hypothetical protein [Helicobacter sp. faydin-H76]
MKKIIVTLVSVFVLGFSLANANPMNAINTSNVSASSTTALSSSDEAMLFGGKANAMVLDNEEMKNTQGFGFWSWFVPVATVGGVVGCAALLGPVCTLGLAF